MAKRKYPHLSAADAMALGRLLRKRSYEPVAELSAEQRAHVAIKASAALRQKKRPVTLAPLKCLGKE